MKNTRNDDNKQNKTGQLNTPRSEARSEMGNRKDKDQNLRENDAKQDKKKNEKR